MSRRKEVSELSPEEVQLFRDATEKLMMKKSTDLTSFFRLSYIHVSNCIHNHAEFFPWHRRYMEKYEKELDVPLPFWNWFKEDDIPEIFRNPTYKDFYSKKIRKNPLYPQKFNAIPRYLIDQTKDALDPEYVEKYLKEFTTSWEDEERVMWNRNKDLKKDFEGMITRYNDGELNTIMTQPPSEFALTFQNFPHGQVHNFVGGITEINSFSMSNLAFSSSDPIFFCHHANVDRLWRLYQKHNPLSKWPTMQQGYGSRDGAIDQKYDQPNTGKPWEPAFPGKTVDSQLDQFSVNWESQKDDRSIFHKLVIGGNQIYVLFDGLTGFQIPFGAEVHLLSKKTKKDYGVIAYTTKFVGKCPCSNAQKRNKTNRTSKVMVTKKINPILVKQKLTLSEVTVIYVYLVRGKTYTRAQLLKIGAKRGWLKKGSVLRPPKIKVDGELRTAVKPFGVNTQKVLPENIIKVASYKKLFPKKLISTKGAKTKIAIIGGGCNLDFSYPSLVENEYLLPKDKEGLPLDELDDAIMGSYPETEFLVKVISSLAPKADIYSYTAADQKGNWKGSKRAIKRCIKLKIDLIYLNVYSTWGFKKMYASITEALNKGIKIITPAGEFNTRYSPDNICYPSRYDSLITIGCANNNGYPSGKSSEGRALDFLFKGINLAVVDKRPQQKFEQKVTSWSGSLVSGILVCALSLLILSDHKTGYHTSEINNNYDLKLHLMKYAGEKFPMDSSRKGYGLFNF